MASVQLAATQAQLHGAAAWHFAVTQLPFGIGFGVLLLWLCSVQYRNAPVAARPSALRTQSAVRRSRALGQWYLATEARAISAPR